MAAPLPRNTLAAINPAAISRLDWISQQAANQAQSPDNSEYRPMRFDKKSIGLPFLSFLPID
jgi:hypothetical protein